jgi:N-acetylglucosamine-6-phosphate deacetylase
MNGPVRYAVAADMVFDGTATHQDTAVVVEGTRVVNVLPRSSLPSDLEVEALAAGDWLAPGFIDVQVNGGGDVLFNDAPTPETIATLVAAHRRLGTTSLLPTLITDSEEKMRAAHASVEAMVGVEPSVLGIHLEGPFISVEKRGVHDASFIREPTTSDVDLLCQDRKGALLVTLAPEWVPEGFIRRLHQSGARIALGHSMATYEETRAAMAEGLSGFTHLFNAMRPLASRDPGPIAAALESDKTWFGMIVDGFHVHPAMLRLALRGQSRPMLVTDAMPPVGGRQTSFRLYGEQIAAVDGRCLRPDGTLSGALLNMSAAVRNCVGLLQTSLEDALRFASRNPADFMGLGHVLGRLAGGYRADMVALDPKSLSVHATWVAGSRRNAEG